MTDNPAITDMDRRISKLFEADQAAVMEIVGLASVATFAAYRALVHHLTGWRIV